MKAISGRWGLILGGLCLLWAVLLIAVQFAGIRRTYVLPPAQIRHELGFAYEVELAHRSPGWPLTAYVSDSNSSPQASALILLENGKAVGQPHSLHDDIRKQGKGDYSHWGRWLIFSATDNSDPRINGRTYSVSVPVALSAFGRITVFLALVIFLWLVRKDDRARQWSDKSLHSARAALAAVLSPRDLSRPAWLGVGVFLLLVLYACTFLISLWRSGTSLDGVVASYYQFSDAWGYWFCSNSLLDNGSLTAWCQRRAIYPSFLSGINFLAGRYIFSTLLLQAVIVCVALFVFLRRAVSLAGMAAAAVCAVLLLAWGTHYLFAFTMTENAGLIFGCLGFALLLKASENRSLAWMAAGMATVSIALSARAGAFFVLPCLVLWAGATAYFSRQNGWRWLGAAVVAGLTGFVLMTVLVLAAGGHPVGEFGNFSYTLYGLAVGGKGWGQTLVDHPELYGHPDAVMSRMAYVLAWKAFLAHPHLFFVGLAKNISLFLASGTYGYDRLAAWGLYAKGLWWLGWVPLLWKWRNPGYLLVALSSLGVVASAPLLLMDGGPRIFAATVAIDALQIGLGLHFLAQILRRIVEGLFGVHPADAPVASPRDGWLRKYLEPLAAAALLAVVILPYTPLRHLQAQKPVTVDDCGADQYTMVTRIGRDGSLLLDISADARQADLLHGSVSREKLVAGLPPGTWWGGDLTKFGEGSLLRAYLLNDAHAYELKGLVFSTTHLSQYYGHVLRMCVDKTEEKKLFNNSYGKLDSLTVMN